MAVKPTALM